MSDKRQIPVERPGDVQPLNSPEPDLGQRVHRAIGPVAAGMIIDFVDLATFGPVGLALGLPIGGLAGYWMGRTLGLSSRASWGCAAAAAVYCTIPFTELLPLGTMVGAYVRFQDGSAGDAHPQDSENPAAARGRHNPDEPGTGQPGVQSPRGQS